MKKMIFVSTGRCGTKRIAEILDQKLPVYFCVEHQMKFSRVANIVGNIIYFMGDSERIKERLYSFIIKKNLPRHKYFISTDPLTSMIIPNKTIKDKDVIIVHIFRESDAFSNSFYLFSKKRLFSFIAHNFVPFWQLYIFPFENMLNKKIKKKYKKIAVLKKEYFKNKYSQNPNYIEIEMNKLFTTPLLNCMIYNFFNHRAYITIYDLNIKSNQS